MENTSNFSRDQVPGNHLKKEGAGEGLEEFVASVAAASPFPGGGSVAALAGSLAAALGEMMAGLTEGRAKYSSVDSQIRAIHKELTDLRNELKGLMRLDVAAYRSLIEAIRLPKGLEAERAVREEAMEKAAKGATETPLQTARAALRVLERLCVLVEAGNPNARCDAAVGAQLAGAALRGAQYNVLCNIRGIKDRAFAENSREEIAALHGRAQEILRQIDSAIGSS